MMFFRKPDGGRDAAGGMQGGVPSGADERLLRVYRGYDMVVSLIRDFCDQRGFNQTIAPALSADFSHPAETHFVIEGDGRRMILPYQQTIANQAATHLLARPTYCIGPCYRREVETGSHIQAFHQFTFEMFTDDLDEVIDFLRALVTDILSKFGPRPDWSLIDLAKEEAANRSIRHDALREARKPTILRHKPLGQPPFLNQRRDDGLEMAFEFYLPGSGETADGGLRDLSVMQQHYDLTPTAQTGGATIGLARLMQAALGLDHVADAALL